MTMLSLKNVSKAYDKKQIVKNISFDIQKGEIFGFLGPNGAGKSTTIEIIAGLKKETAGMITLDGEKLHDTDRYNLIGVQLQNAELYGELTVKETLILFLSFHNRQAFLSDHISLTKLDSFLHQKIKTLSGGQKQRLTLSLSLANDPSLIILDEPTVGLDPQSRRLLWSVIQELKGAGKTILLTTHFMDEAQHLCDRVAIIDEGTILLIDTVDHLLMKNKNRFSVFIETSPEIYPFLSDDENFVDMVKNDNEIMIRTNNVEVLLNQVLMKIKQHELLLQKVVIKEANLEDLFIQLTGKELRE